MKQKLGTEYGKIFSRVNSGWLFTSIALTTGIKHNVIDDPVKILRKVQPLENVASFLPKTRRTHDRRAWILTRVLRIIVSTGCLRFQHMRRQLFSFGHFRFRNYSPAEITESLRFVDSWHTVQRIWAAVNSGQAKMIFDKIILNLLSNFIHFYSSKIIWGCVLFMHWSTL